MIKYCSLCDREIDPSEIEEVSRLCLKRDYCNACYQAMMYTIKHVLDK